MRPANATQTLGTHQATWCWGYDFALGCAVAPNSLEQSGQSKSPYDISKRPDLAALAKNPSVAAGIAEAWKNSNSQDPKARRENGFWILRNNEIGDIYYKVFKGNATRNTIDPGSKPNIPGLETIAFFHTHPNPPPAEQGPSDYYVNGVRRGDVAFALRPDINIPGIILAYDGKYYGFGPALSQPPPVTGNTP